MKRYRIRCTEAPKPPAQHWVTDGDQDGDAWEGTAEEAKRTIADLGSRYKDGSTFKAIEVDDFGRPVK